MLSTTVQESAETTKKVNITNREIIAVSVGKGKFWRKTKIALATSALIAFSRTPLVAD
jgi:hypothetical protein